MSPDVRRGLTLRVLLAGLVAFGGAYLTVITVYVLWVLGPSIVGLRERTDALSAEYDQLRTRVAQLEDAFITARTVAQDDRCTPEERAQLAQRRELLRTVTEHSAGVQASQHVFRISPAVRGALAELAGAESRWAAVLQETYDLLDAGNVPAARARLADAASTRGAMLRNLDEAQRRAFAEMAASERQLGGQATRVATTLGIWAIGGGVFVVFAFAAVRRRLYVPLRAIDAGLARVEHGDFSASLPVRRDDELGRLSAHFNQMTALLKTRADADQSRHSTLAERFASILAHSFNEICVYHAGSYRVLQMNQGARAALGYADDEVAELRLFDILAGYDEASFVALLHPLETGERSAIEIAGHHVRKNGTRYPVDVTLQLWATETPAVLVAIAQDVTDRRRGEINRLASLRIAESALTADSLEAMFGAIHGVVADLMPARNFYIALYDAEADQLTFPYFVDEFDPPPAPKRLGRGCTEYVIRSGRPMLVTPEVFEDLVAKGEVERVGAPSVDWVGVPLVADGRTIGAFVVQTYAEGMRYTEADLDILRFVSAQVAIAIARRRAEQDVRENQQRLQHVLDAAPFGAHLYELRPDGRLVFIGANRSADRILGVPNAQFVGRSIEEAFPPLAETGIPAAYRRAAAEGVPFETEQLEYGDDQRIRGAFEVHAIRTEPGRIAVFFQDITARKQVEASLRRERDLEEQLRRSEEQFRQAQKMESIGRLAGGVAHDFNNFLTVMAGFSAQAREDIPAGHPAQAALAEVESACEKAAALTRQLLAFARRQVTAPQALNLNHVAVSMDTMLRRLIGEDVDLVTRFGSDIWTVSADPTQIQQVVVNLAVNARDAMPSGGKLTIETSNVTLDDTYAAGHASVAPGDYVMLAITDSGHGMSPETLDHLFEPFYTTKRTGRGTGLGLATCYGIVQQAGGSITVYSEPDNGTTFKIYLPRVFGPASAIPGESRLAPVRGTEHVLLVEDEEKVRAVAAHALRDFGYTVTEAANGEEALALATGRIGDFDVVVTDVVMPQMGGRELAGRLQALRPDLPVLYTSGYTEDGIVHHGVLTPGLAFLAKPYQPASLARKVREVIDRAR